MPYWQLYYHIVTATKGRAPLLTSQTANVIFKAVREKAKPLDISILAINGVLDHIHIVAAVPPKLAVATAVGQLKGFASAQVNERQPLANPFQWQDSYGVFSFDKKRLPFVIAYVENQQAHHQEGSMIAALEQSDEPGHRMAEGQALYRADGSEDDDFPF